MSRVLEQQPRFNARPVSIMADRTVVPYTSGNETIPLTLSPFQDHGRPAFIGSTIKSRHAVREVASELSPEESQRIDAITARTMEELLNEGRIGSTAIFTSTAVGKPDVHVIVVGDPYRDNSLRLYCHSGQYEGAQVLFQDGKSRKRDASKVEKALRDSGYTPPKNWGDRTKNHR